MSVVHDVGSTRPRTERCTWQVEEEEEGEEAEKKKKKYKTKEEEDDLFIYLFIYLFTILVNLTTPLVTLSKQQPMERERPTKE